ncbi:hypothetical protein M406DRAFT_358352 [Cryphonectria parasitica EP155]|uniref:Pyridoxamine 5'-phosphate oxidase putative domain-containing protein n=1 Tax=Cryphonectria parasitica (strain ATCC 38755 / EP155) TaxID=660469 RepID=A0A9P4XU52_CRYP1|nr:uncharacterized protein M406DRAFT_358352 [Cryphonectria parasitica EP155]KAF3760825.1 hypothetical protein M406DRAFT_358352 [Cryphonectria parasitica EP155]
MGSFYETMPRSLFQWILAQKIFWVATAPLSGSGHVNISPKGGSYFGLIDDKTFWYMDLTGSGSETIAHLYEKGNGRITVLFNAFEGPPRILRLFGHGEVFENGTGPFEEFVKKHDVTILPGTRAIVLAHIHQVGTSCGFSVPFYEYKEHRNTLNQYFEKKDAKFRAGNEKESMPRYWAQKNSWSMDGLPALHVAQKTMVQEKIQPSKKMVGPRAPSQYQNANRFGLEHLILVALATAILTTFVMSFGAETARTVAVKLHASTSPWVGTPLRTAS